MSEKGWVKIDRKIIDHWVWDDRPFSKGQAWIDLLLLANFKEKKFIRKNEVVEGKRGCVYESILGLSRRWGWSREKTTRFLKQLESDGMVRINATRQQTTITLVNYGIYQDSDTTHRATKKQWTDNEPYNEPTTTEEREECKNDKNECVSNLVNINNYIPAPPPIAWGTPIPDLTNEILQQIIEAWNSIPHTVKLNGIRPQSDRYEKLRVVYAMIGLDGIMRAIQRVRDSKWMQNQGHIAFNSFIANPDRVNELLEGNYDVVFETERKPKTRKESSFDNFSQRDYDYAELEKKLMGKN